MIARLLLATLASVTAPAHADDRVGVVVAGDPTLQAPVSAEVATWLQKQGHRVEAAPLPGPAVAGFLDCFVLEDTACAKKIVQEQARTDAIVYARVESSFDATRTVTITAHWIDKHDAVLTQKTACRSCTDEALEITLDALLFSLRGAASAATATATAPEGAAAAAVPGVSAVQPSPASPVRTGLAVGAELGEPTSATIGWFTNELALVAAIGSGTLAGPGISIHADVQRVVTRLRPELPLRVGLGARIYHHGYEPVSIDEIPHEHYGIRVPVALGYERGPLELYAELAPGVDLKRTASCTLADGPRSLCPHAQTSPLFVQLVVGARWFISH